ncbi:hypothetical protein HN446_03340 [bacterium]|nr:hypothetical protein [bacterium]
MKVLLFLALFLFWSQNISAYIDPCSGSMIIQLLIAALVGGGFAIKVFWVKIKDFLVKIYKFIFRKK